MSTATEGEKSLLQYAKERGFSIVGLARRTGITHSRLYYGIYRQGEATLTEAEKLCEALGCDLEILKTVLRNRKGAK
jgi:hypothetical protein